MGLTTAKTKKLNEMLRGVSSASRQDRLTRFILLPETNQRTKRDMGKMVFKTLYIKLHKMVIPERGKVVTGASQRQQLASLKGVAVYGAGRGPRGPGGISELKN